MKFGVLNTAACFIAYRAALDELSLSVPGSGSQQELFCFVRYMNAILHSLCSGLYADGQNPKLFLSNWGLAAGRPLAIIPTLPFLVWVGIRLWDMSCPPPRVEAIGFSKLSNMYTQRRSKKRHSDNGAAKTAQQKRCSENDAATAPRKRRSENGAAKTTRVCLRFRACVCVCAFTRAYACVWRKEGF